MMRGEALEKSMFFMSNPDWYYYLDEDDDEFEFLCNARNEATRIASYLRSLMTKQCMKILIKANSMN